MEQLHPIQRRILFDLLFEKNLNYAGLKPIYMENSQFVFHIKQLIKEGFISKHGSIYKLTQAGKEFANRLDVGTLEFADQPKSTAVFCAIRNSDEYLLYKRSKNPFYGCYGFPTQKILWGETAVGTAAKGLKEETGLEISSDPKLFAIRHYRIYTAPNNLIEDKYMYCFLIKNPKGVISSNFEGDFFWVAENSIEDTVKKPQEEFFDILDALKKYKKAIFFKEISVITKNF